MTTIAYATEDYLGADEYIDVVKKSGLNRPVDDRGRVERYLKHSNLFVTARENGKLIGFARSLTDFCFCCYLSDLAVDRGFQGKGIGKRLIDLARAELNSLLDRAARADHGGLACEVRDRPLDLDYREPDLVANEPRRLRRELHEQVPD